ncbi:MAG: hypothetical protein ABJN42_10525 [Roseibium sp.]|uniref:hypothetical protein n=1 Tax=Roseibium sp. TaxID=1936156 RepID=UPI003297164D
MPGLFYRLSAVIDPEERLEDACLSKAMHDHYQAGITILPPDATGPDEGVTFGRTKRYEATKSMSFGGYEAYWQDPGFIHSVQREFASCDLDEAEKMVKHLHAAGKDVFIKSREQKLYNASIPRGQKFHEVIGDMAFSFMDKPDCLLVQEYVEMRNERRFVVIDGKIATCSPVQTDLTPMSRAALFEDAGVLLEDIHFSTPTSRDWTHDPGLTREMYDHAEEVIAHATTKNMILDLATVGDRAEVIEYNPMSPGMFGLFGCRPDKIAQASEALLPEDLFKEVLARRESGVPLPAPDQAPSRSPASFILKGLKEEEDAEFEDVEEIEFDDDDLPGP